MGYGVIGNTKVSGSFVLGSSPGIPANLLTEVAAPSYSGLVLRPLTAATPVQIRLGSPLGKKLSSRKTGELLCLSGKNKPRIYSAAAYSSKHKWLLGGKETGRKKGTRKI